jgi:hypothetical protein
VLVPVTARAKLTFHSGSELTFTKKQVAALVLLVVVGIGSAIGYLSYRYTDTSRSADYTDKQRVEANKAQTQLVLDKTDDWDDETVVCIVDSAYRPLFGAETDYTVSIYILDKDAFAAGQAADKKYDMDTLWGYSKSGPKKDPYGSLIKVGTVTFTQEEKTGKVTDFKLTAVQ